MTRTAATGTGAHGNRRRAIRNAAADEKRLVARAQRGDTAAFDELAGRYSSRLRRTLYRITRDCDAAIDAMQEALVRAWQNIRRFKGRSRFYTWLTRIGINEAYRELGRAAVETVELDDSVGERVPAWGERPDEAFESREFLAAVAEALAELPTD
jgi:RNA polymerase sigma-70 factor (ECF subfamily)